MNYAIILSGGKGSRMKSSIPKQYIEINGKPMISYSIEVFDRNDNIDGIVIVPSADYIEYMRKLADRHGYKKIIGIVEGGAERYDSVYSGLKYISNLINDDVKLIQNIEQTNSQNNNKDNKNNNEDNKNDNKSNQNEGIARNSSIDNYVYIHDGARPCVTDNIINSCNDDVKKYGACVAAVPVKDTIKVVDDNGIAVNTPDRSTLWQVQTPQVFEYSLIKNAYDRLYDDADKIGITDDAMVAERYMDARVKMTMSEYTNIKATTPEDIMITREFLSVR